MSDNKLVELEKWGTVLTLSEFVVVKDFIARRAESYRAQADTARQLCTQDGLLRSSHLSAKADELKTLLSLFEDKLKEKQKSDHLQLVASAKINQEALHAKR